MTRTRVLAAVLEVHDRHVAGWAKTDRLRTEPASEVLVMAVGRRRPESVLIAPTRARITPRSRWADAAAGEGPLPYAMPQRNPRNIGDPTPTRMGPRPKEASPTRWNGFPPGPATRQGQYGGQGQNRTADTRIFSPLLYRLSYLAVDAALNEDVAPAVKDRTEGEARAP